MTTAEMWRRTRAWHQLIERLEREQLRSSPVVTYLRSGRLPEPSPNPPIPRTVVVDPKRPPVRWKREKSERY